MSLPTIFSGALPFSGKIIYTLIMPRTGRIFIPGIPHHITQRGNRRQTVFFDDECYQYFIKLMNYWSEKHKVEIISFCLMPNHTHLVLVPETISSIGRMLQEVHRRYTRSVNQRMGWQGHLWQCRYYSVPLLDVYVDNAIRYVELNPVRAGICI